MLPSRSESQPWRPRPHAPPLFTPVPTESHASADEELTSRVAALSVGDESKAAVRLALDISLSAVGRTRLSLRIVVNDALPHNEHADVVPQYRRPTSPLKVNWRALRHALPSPSTIATKHSITSASGRPRKFTEGRALHTKLPARSRCRPSARASPAARR